MRFFLVYILTSASLLACSQLLVVLKNGETARFKRLLKTKQHCTHINVEGFPLIHHSILLRDKDAFKLLLKNDKGIWHAKDRSSPLHWAAYLGENGILKDLLAKYPNVINYQNKKGQTALMLAISQRNQDGFNALLKEKASLEIVSRDGKTALLEACLKGNLEMARTLIKKGAAIEQKSISGQNCLHYAIGGSPLLLDYILSKGVQVDARDNQGWTALMRATHRCLPTEVRILLKYGAKHNIKSFDDRSVYDRLKLILRAYKNKWPKDYERCKKVQAIFNQN